MMALVPPNEKRNYNAVLQYAGFYLPVVIEGAAFQISLKYLKAVQG